MICGRLDGWRQIDGVNGLEAGFEFLERSNLATLAMGKHEIQGEAVFALAMKAPSKDPRDARFESHRDYIDIQFLFAGESKWKEKSGGTIIFGASTRKCPLKVKWSFSIAVIMRMWWW